MRPYNHAGCTAPQSPRPRPPGLRPRHIALGESEGDIPGQVYSHEMVGRELQLLIRIDGGVLRFRTRERMPVRAGERLRVRLDLAGARLFDRTTGQALA